MGLIFSLTNVETKINRRQVELTYDIIDYEAVSSFIARHRLDIKGTIQEKYLKMSLDTYKEIEKEFSKIATNIEVTYRATPEDIKEALIHQRHMCEARAKDYASNVLGLQAFRYSVNEVEIDDKCLYDYGCKSEKSFPIKVSYKFNIK